MAIDVASEVSHYRLGMIVNRIAYWRTTKLNGKGVSQAHLARQVKVGRSFINKLEKGKAQPSADLIFRISKYFDQPVEQVFQPQGREFPPIPYSHFLSCSSSGNGTSNGQIVASCNGEGRGVPVAQ